MRACTAPRLGHMPTAPIQPVEHSLLRKQALALARPSDHAGSFVATVDPAFSLGATIFQTLPVGVKTYFQRTKLDNKLLFHERARAAIEAAYARAGPAPVIADDTPLHAFMLTECHFSMEHADGSFLDHLFFCREYAPHAMRRTLSLWPPR